MSPFLTKQLISDTCFCAIVKSGLGDLAGIVLRAFKVPADEGAKLFC